MVQYVSRPLPEPGSQRLCLDGDCGFDAAPDTILPVENARNVIPMPRRNGGKSPDSGRPYLGGSAGCSSSFSAAK